MKNIYALTFFCFISLFSLCAWGHAFPKKQIPSPDAHLTKSPPKVIIQFNSLIEPNFSTLKVVNSHGKQVSIGKGTVNIKDSTLLTVELPLLSKDQYHVYWRVAARDGYITQGHYQFSIQ